MSPHLKNSRAHHVCMETGTYKSWGDLQKDWYPYHVLCKSVNWLKIYWVWKQAHWHDKILCVKLSNKKSRLKPEMTVITIRTHHQQITMSRIHYATPASNRLQTALSQLHPWPLRERLLLIHNAISIKVVDRIAWSLQRRRADAYFNDNVKAYLTLQK